MKDKPKKADTELRACWLKKDGGDVNFYWPGDKRCDARLLNLVFCSPRPRMDYSEGVMPKLVFDKSFTDELEARGYDITTLRFCIKLKKEQQP